MHALDIHPVDLSDLNQYADAIIVLKKEVKTSEKGSGSMVR